MTLYRILFAALVALALGAASPATAQAQYPERPVRLIVPFPAGGGADIVGRLIAERFEAFVGQPLVVENVAGAAGSLAAQRVAGSPGDGYTLLLGGGSELLIRKHLQASTPYDAFRDFTPIGMVGAGPMVFIAKKGLGVDDLPSVLGLARSKPGALNYGSGGRGTYMHLVGEAVKSRAGVNITHVPYRGAPPVLTDIASGHLDLGVVSLSSALPLIESGRVLPLAVTSLKRVQFAAKIPALSEAKELDGLHLELWMGLFAPAGLPSPVKAKLEATLEKIVADPGFKSKLADQAFEARNLTGKPFEDMLRSENERYFAIIKAGGITAE